MNICPECYHKVVKSVGIRLAPYYCPYCELLWDDDEILTEYSVVEIEVSRIYSPFRYSATLPLLKLIESINQNGLLSAIIIQPAFDTDGLPDGFDFRIVDGNFRFEAIKALNKATIPCMIKVGLPINASMSKHRGDI